MRCFKIFSPLPNLITFYLLSTIARSEELLSGLESIGKPVPGGTSFQPAVTDLARDILWLDNMLLIFLIDHSKEKSLMVCKQIFPHLGGEERKHVHNTPHFF